MNTSEILNSLREQLIRINKALAALGGSSHKGLTRNGRRRGRRRMSSTAKRRISEAMKKRWAQRKKK
ncbi:MAG TPA: hypothetical protein VFR24_17305 [Candidatus Angelobacter sp.]|nr:hypothetical protein [Candidatus Angelobacter sp.]